MVNDTVIDLSSGTVSFMTLENIMKSDSLRARVNSNSKSGISHLNKQ